MPLTPDLPQRLAVWRATRKAARKAGAWHPALAVTRRALLAGMMVTGGAASAQASWLRFAAAAAAPVIPAAQAQYFAAQSDGEHDVAQPGPDTAVYAASANGNIERPTLTIDAQEDIHVQAGSSLLVSVSSDHSDLAKQGVSFRLTLCGSAGYTQASFPEAMVVSPRTGSIGTLVNITVPAQVFGAPTNGKGYLIAIFESVPKNGTVQRLVRRIIVEGTDFPTYPGNIVCVSGGDPAASDANTGASTSAPLSTFYQAQTSVNDGGRILVDGRYPLLWDKERTGSNNKVVFDAIEVRPYAAATWSLTRTGRANLDGFALGVNSQWPNSPRPEVNKLHFYNASYDTYRLPFLILSTQGTTGVNFAWIGCTFTHDQMARDGHFMNDGWSNDGLVDSNAVSGTTLPYHVALIGCSGLIPSMGANSLGINNTIQHAWDHFFAPAAYEFSAGWVRHNLEQNRSFIGCAHAVNQAKLPITAIYKDTFNEIATLGLAWETYAGTASITISGTTATVRFYGSDGVTRQPFCMNKGMPIVFDNGPLAGTKYTSWQHSNGGGQIAITGIPSGTTSDPTQRYTLKFRSWLATQQAYGATSANEFNQLRITDGAGKSAYVPSDPGGSYQSNGIKNPNDPRKMTPDYPVPNYIFKSSMGIVSYGQQGAPFLALPPLWYTPYATVAGTTLTACAQNGPVAGSGTLSVVQTANGYVAMVSGGSFTAAQINEGVTIRAGGYTFRAAAAVNATGATGVALDGDGNASPMAGMAPYSFYLRDWNPSWSLAGASWTFSTVEGHGLVPGNQVQFGSGPICNVASVNGRQVTLDQAPGDLSTPTTFARGIGSTVDQVTALIPSYNAYGQPIATLLDPVAIGDGVFMDQPGNNQHNDNFQNQINSQPGGRGTNFHTQNARQRGSLLQAIQIGMTGATFRAGQIQTTQGSNAVSFVLPTLPLGAPTATGSKKVYGTSYPAFTFVVDYSATTPGRTPYSKISVSNLNNWGSAKDNVTTYYKLSNGTWTDYLGNSVAAPSGADTSTGPNPCADTTAGYCLFNLPSPKREVRVLIKSGVYAGKSFRMHSQSVSGAVATMILLDDKGVTGGTWGGAAADTFKQPLLIFDGDVILVGDSAPTLPSNPQQADNIAAAKLTAQGRMFINDPANIGAGWLDAPMTAGTAYDGFTGSLTEPHSNWQNPYQFRDVGTAATQQQFGYEDYNAVTIPNVPLGGVGNMGMRNFFWKQSSWFLGKNKMIRAGFVNKSSGMYAFAVIDSLHAGFKQPSNYGGNVRAGQLGITGSLLAALDTTALASDMLSSAAPINTTLAVDPDTATPSIAGGLAIPMVVPTNLFDHMGLPRAAGVSLQAGCV